MTKIYQKLSSVSKAAGFTLIELLVVVLIIGILSAVALPKYQQAVLKARYVQVQTAADTLARSKELYLLANGTEAQNMNDLDILPSNCEVHESGNQCSATQKYYCYLSGYCCSMDSGHSLCHSVNAKGRYCMALTGHAAANAVCKSMGGKQQAGISSFTYYLLP